MANMEVKMIEKLILAWVKNKLEKLIVELVYQQELVQGAKKGVQKLEAVESRVWGMAEDLIIKAIRKDLPFIPNHIENVIDGSLEDIALWALNKTRETFNLKKFINDVVIEGKKATNKM